MEKCHVLQSAYIKVKDGAQVGLGQILLVDSRHAFYIMKNKRIVCVNNFCTTENMDLTERKRFNNNFIQG
jgi:hypothetical protein